MTYTEAVTPPTQMHNIGTPRTRMFETPLSNRCGVSVKITPSPLTGIGVTAVWPCHRPVMPTGRKPVNIPTQWCGAVGSLAVYGEEEVTGHSRRGRHRL